MNILRYSKKLVNSSYYGTLSVDSSTNSRRISIIKRRNKLRKIYDLDSKIEDESQGYIYAPFTVTATVPRYYASVDMVHTSGIEPAYSQVYIRTKKSEN